MVSCRVLNLDVRQHPSVIYSFRVNPSIRRNLGQTVRVWLVTAKELTCSSGLILSRVIDFAFSSSHATPVKLVEKFSLSEVDHAWTIRRKSFVIVYLFFRHVQVLVLRTSDPFPVLFSSFQLGRRLLKNVGRPRFDHILGLSNYFHATNTLHKLSTRRSVYLVTNIIIVAYFARRLDRSQR